MGIKRVFVHGNPETAAVWMPLRDALVASGISSDEIVCLSPPGFGAPLPHDFEPVAESYRSWLADELDELRSGGDTVDLVGHDWGAGHVYGLLADRPDAVRSWAADIGGLLHPDYVWHDAAQAWQTPEVGEQVIDMMVTMPLDERVALFEGLGLPNSMAAEMAPALDADMGRAVLALYRSAPEPELQALADRLAATTLSPGLIITAVDDAYVSADLAGPVAQRLGADELRLDGQGHWWMVSDPLGAAAGLLDFWSRL
ncbi:MAG: alpha/beta fold hydrolase [Ilumatobacter sp.]|jgi:pimeloyl-ACP methyl ester carboxylesterase|uniref:alpha/beta fold hydrolase n=1 Tax=Ilumatobacter sp. TaxID=1967498 RepID=UPI00391C5C66